MNLVTNFVTFVTSVTCKSTCWGPSRQTRLETSQLSRKGFYWFRNLIQKGKCKNVCELLLELGELCESSFEIIIERRAEVNIQPPHRWALRSFQRWSHSKLSISPVQKQNPSRGREIPGLKYYLVSDEVRLKCLCLEANKHFKHFTWGPWMPSAVWMVRCNQEVQTRISEICNS